MKKRIAVVAGGDSGEFEISVRSGQVAYRNIDPCRYEAWFVLIKGLDWHVLTDDGRRYPIDRNDFSFFMDGEKRCFDLVFVAIHGNPGENGRLQAYLDLLGIPYTSSDHLVSAITFNKHVCKHLVAGFGVPVAPSVLLSRGQDWSAERLIDKLGLPVFVKPNSNGSSVGISKVKTVAELEPAVNAAFELDHEALVESFMPGREITCGVMRDEGRVIAFPVTEIISKKEFFDYEAKYNPALSDEIVPAQIPAGIFTRCQDLSVQLYDQLKCRGVVRFDYIFQGEQIRFLEVNIVPGLTEVSIVPRMATAYGWSIAQLFSKMVENSW